MKTPYEYHLLGMMGDKIGEGIPVFTGLPHTISAEALRNLGAQLNTSGAYGMYHIVGCTPEAPTVEVALGGKKPKYEVVITNEDLQNVEDTFSDKRDNDKVDFAMFGCPHFTLEEAQHIAEGVKGKKLAIPMYILVSSHALQMAQRMASPTCWPRPAPRSSPTAAPTSPAGTTSRARWASPSPPSAPIIPAAAAFTSSSVTWTPASRPL